MTNLAVREQLIFAVPPHEPGWCRLRRPGHVSKNRDIWLRVLVMPLDVLTYEPSVGNDIAVGEENYFCTRFPYAEVTSGGGPTVGLTKVADRKRGALTDFAYR